MSRTPKTSLAALLAALSVTACAAAATPGEAATSRSSALSCEIRATPTRNGLKLEALAEAARAVRGEYDLVVTKSGPGGSSDISQGGAFSLAANERAVLGVAEVGLERRATINARLILRDGRSEVCRSQFRT